MPEANAPRVAVLGAGIAGAAAASALTGAGCAVRVFDKARGPGGRMASRRVTLDDGTAHTFDHGAQWTAPRDPRFAAFLANATSASAAAPWPQGATGAMVGTPRMNALVRFALGDTDARYGVTVSSLRRDADGWHLADEAGPVDGPFAAVVSTVPAPQFVPLGKAHAPELARSAAGARYAPCWALMLAFAPERAADLAVIAHDALAGDGFNWLAHDGGKPGRSGATLVVHADGDWSSANLELARETVAEMMTAVVRSRLGLPEPRHAAAHRWRYSRVLQCARGVAVDPCGIAIAGDWTAGPNVESAYCSGLDVAAKLLPHLKA